MSMRSACDRLQDARRCLDRGSLREALALCRPILGGLPLDPDVCAVTGTALLGSGRAFQAFRVIAPACEASPERTDLQRLKISCLLDGGRFELARRSAERALHFAPDDAGLLGMVTEADARIADLRCLLHSAPRLLLTAEQRAELGQDFRSNYRMVPVIINSRDRCSCLEQLIVWLRSAGYENIAILDNRSTYPPLLEYLRRVEHDVPVLRLSRNLGPRALWSSGLIGSLSEVPFVYTDPDVVPVEECPRDAVARLAELLDAHPQVTKAGLGIKIDDLPDTYAHKSAVRAWEANFWRRPLSGSCYDAAVDTTFALYRPGSWHQLRAVRAGSPYLARHLPWYADSSRPTPEDLYYAEHATADMSSWSGNTVSDMYGGQRGRDIDDETV